jgi:hypothetical protein
MYLKLNKMTNNELRRLCRLLIKRAQNLELLPAANPVNRRQGNPGQPIPPLPSVDPPLPLPGMNPAARRFPNMSRQGHSWNPYSDKFWAPVDRGAPPIVKPVPGTMPATPPGTPAEEMSVTSELDALNKRLNRLNDLYNKNWRDENSQVPPQGGK